VKTVVRVYAQYEQAQQVVADLRDWGVPGSAINLIGNQHICEETARLEEPTGAGPAAGAGVTLGGGAGLLAALGIVAIPGLGPAVAAGPLAAAAVGAVAGATAGGLFGTLLNQGISDAAADRDCEMVRRGGTMVRVHVRDERAGDAAHIMDRLPALDPPAPRDASR
jgi:hypothetical protein